MAEALGQMRETTIGTRCAWGFKEYQEDPVRQQNDRILKSLDYRTSTISGHDAASPEKWISNILAETRNREVTFVVDISSMTRNWYGGMVRALALAQRSAPVRSIFVYTPAQWSESKDPFPPNEVLGPVPGYSSHALPNKPTALIVGLGVEPDRGLGLRDHLDPHKTVCFYAQPGADPRYEKAALRANKDLLASVGEAAIFTYDLFDTFAAYKTLESVCFGLSKDYRVVIASLGPKIFGLYCFLLASSTNDVSVWRVSPATRQGPRDHKALDNRAFLDVIWGV